jgi:hypothetical protein
MRIVLSIAVLTTLPALAGCLPVSPTPAPPITITRDELLANYQDLSGEPVLIKGYGIVEAMLPLCEGYTGMDTRRVFVDEARNTIPATLADIPFEQAFGSGQLRVFEGIVKEFSGTQGCPGSLAEVTFPYLEITGVRELK